MAEMKTFNSMMEETVEEPPTQGTTEGAEAGEEGSQRQSVRRSRRDSEERANIRRQQVRRAQINHRQRRANYVRDLELSVDRTREMISEASQDLANLRSANDTMRDVLVSSMSMPSSAAGDVGLFDSGMPTGNAGMFDVPPVSVALGVDEAMQMPCYHIVSPHTENIDSFAATHTGWAPDLIVEQLEASGLPVMMPEQMQPAIDFILALEHPCWNHFNHVNANFASALAIPDPQYDNSGHAMMASALALQHAPQPVLDTLQATREANRQQQAVAATTATSSTHQQPQPPNVPQAEPPCPQPPHTDFSWDATCLILANLYALSKALAPPDVELTPVQAFFELVDRLGIETLLRRDVYDSLKREFVGVVRCQHYGAAIEREAFESVVQRVLEEVVYGGSERDDSVGEDDV